MAFAGLSIIHCRVVLRPAQRKVGELSSRVCPAAMGMPKQPRRLKSHLRFSSVFFLSLTASVTAGFTSVLFNCTLQVRSINVLTWLKLEWWWLALVSTWSPRSLGRQEPMAEAGVYWRSRGTRFAHGGPLYCHTWLWGGTQIILREPVDAHGSSMIEIDEPSYSEPDDTNHILILVLCLIYYRK